MIVYRLLFWLPAVMAAYGLRVAWQSGLVARPLLSVGLLLLGLVLQTIGALFSPAWAVGLVVNVALAVYFQVTIRRGL